MLADIHQDQIILRAGSKPDEANLTVILLHGRGATAESMLSIANALALPGVHFLLPQAAFNRWYPNTAFGPLKANEPDLTSALNRISTLIDELNDQGFATRQIAIGGFSQGACLASEYVARNAKRYAGLFAFSGALIGPPDMERDYPGTFDQMPIFIGGSNVDPWVRHDLMEDAAALFTNMGAKVDFRTYPDMAHTINQDEIDAVKSMFGKSLSELD